MCVRACARIAEVTLCAAHLNAFLHVHNVSHAFTQCELCIVSFTRGQAEGELAAGCFTGVYSAVIRPDLGLTRAHQE